MAKTKSDTQLLDYIDDVSKKPEAFGIKGNGDISLPWLMPSILSTFSEDYPVYQSASEFERIMGFINRHASSIDDNTKKSVLNTLIHKETFISYELSFIMNFGNATEKKMAIEKTIENNENNDALDQMAKLAQSTNDLDIIFEVMTSKIKSIGLSDIKLADSTLIKILQAFSKHNDDPGYYNLAKNFAIAKTGFGNSCFFIHRLAEYQIPVDIGKIVDDILSTCSANAFDSLIQSANQVLKPESVEEDTDILKKIGYQPNSAYLLEREDALVVNTPFPEIGKMILESTLLHIVKKKNRVPYANMKELLETLKAARPLGIIEKTHGEIELFLSRQIKIAQDQMGEDFLHAIHFMPPMLQYLSKELNENLIGVISTSISRNNQRTIELVSKNLDLMLYLKASPEYIMTFTNDFTNQFKEINSRSPNWINIAMRIPDEKTCMLDTARLIDYVDRHQFYKDEIKNMNQFDKFAAYKFSSETGYWNILKLMTIYSGMPDSDAEKFIKDRFIDLSDLSLDGEIRSNDLYRSLFFNMPEFMAKDIEIKKRMMTLAALSIFDETVANKYKAPFAPVFMHYLDFIDRHIIPDAKRKYTDWIKSHADECHHPINAFFESVLQLKGTTAVLSAMEINPKTKEGRLIMCYMLNQQFDGILKHDTSIEKVNVDTSVGIDLANI